jgi:hypothetical protein
MAERTGLEPAASGVTGRRYNRLNYRSFFPLLRTARLPEGPETLRFFPGFSPGPLREGVFSMGEPGGKSELREEARIFFGMCDT